MEKVQDNSIFKAPDISVNLNPVSEQEFREIVYDRLQAILRAEFPNTPQKQSIKKGYDSLQFACPFCGDSGKNLYKKRGNIIFKDGDFKNTFKCFNCGTYMPLRKFFQRFNTQLPAGATDFMIQGEQARRTGEYRMNAKSFDADMFAGDLEELAVPVGAFAKAFNLQRVGPDCRNRAFNYLQGRCQYRWEHFLYNPYSDKIIIMNLLDRDRMIGFQTRDIRYNGVGPKYVTASLKKIHDGILRSGREVPRELEEISMLFGLFQADPNLPVFVTEGPLDALLLPNAIATCGAGKTPVVDLPYWWIYDSDRAGLKHAFEKIEAGEKAFMWDWLKRDLKIQDRKKVDVTDVFKHCRDNKLPLPKWTDYFSDNPLDALSL